MVFLARCLRLATIAPSRPDWGASTEWATREREGEGEGEGEREGEGEGEEIRDVAVADLQM